MTVRGWNMTHMTAELQTGIDQYLAACEADYTRTSRHSHRQIRFILDPGRKFIRIWRQFDGESQRSCHAFVVLMHPKFRCGDLLKPATWKAPAMNAARGNVLEPSSYRAQWTGPEYLR